MIEIKNSEGIVLYASETASGLRAALVEPEAAPPAESTNGKPQPHGILVAAKEGGADGERDWIAWGTTLAAALKAAAPDEVEEWLKRNADQLNNCKQQAPAIHKRLLKIAAPKPQEEAA